MEPGLGTAPRPLPPLLPLAIALVAIVLGWDGRGSATEPARASSSAWRAGVAWAVLGALPVAAAASIWSAYYYLFALCGLSIVLGVVLARQRRVVALGAVALLAWGSGYARGLESFSTAPGSWNTESHFNRTALVADTQPVAQYAAELKRVRPRLAPKSTLFVSDVPGLLDCGVVVPVIDADEAGKLLDAGAFQGGIIPKLRAAITAAQLGVRAEIGRTQVVAA